MDKLQFVKEKRDEILALAARHNAADVRLVVAEALQDKPLQSGDGIKLVARFTGDPQLPAYLEALIAFQNDLEMWLDVSVHVYDARGFKGADGEEYLQKTVPV